MAIANNILESGRSALRSVTTLVKNAVLPAVFGLSLMGNRMFDGPTLEAKQWPADPLGIACIAIIGALGIGMAIASVTVWKYEPPQGRPIKERKKK